jgi:hypothetical protein
VAKLGEPAVPEEIARRASSFVGRGATLDAISDWLNRPAPAQPWFLVTGGPGSGKSALVAWLAGAGPKPSTKSPAHKRRRIHANLRAVHFCDADGGRAAQSLDPLVLANSIVRQLSRGNPAYANELAQQLRINLNITMTAENVGRVEGPTFGTINVQSPASLFNSALDALRWTTPGLHLIAVDALDEAELWRGGVRIRELLSGISQEMADSGIRILMTSRPVQSIIDAFPPDARWDLDDAGDADVATYVTARLAALPNVSKSLAVRLTAASAGNFMVAKLLTDFAKAQPGQIGALASEFEASGRDGGMWAGLDEVYSRFLWREFGTPGESPEWTNAARPVLGTIAVARQKLLDEQIEWLVEPDRDALQAGVVERALPRCLQYLDGDLPSGPFGLYHFSFREFLFRPGRPFSTQEWKWHELVANRFDPNPDVGPFTDHYGLRYILGHRADAVRLAPRDRRVTLANRLVALALSDEFHQQHDKHVDDPVALIADFDRVMDAVSLSEGDDAPLLVIACALGLGSRRGELGRPDRVFELAATGQLDRAERRLELFAVDDELRLAALLVCAWLAPPEQRETAVDLCDRVASQHLVRPLPELLARVRAELDGEAPIIHDSLPYTPPGIPEFILNTLAGVDPQVDPSMLEFVDSFRLGVGEHIDAEQLVDAEALESSDAGPRLRAAREAGFLVTYARDDPERGDPLLDHYIALHAANSYVLYRNRSLWAILESVVLHPSQEWVLDRTKRVLQGSLVGSAPDFVEGLPLAVLAIQAAYGSQPAKERWQQIVGETAAEASAISSGRGRDEWSHLKRRVAVLAEIEQAHGRGPDAQHLADLAASIDAGFAGYRAPASLTIAETLFVTGSTWPTVAGQIEQALRAAHNCQDPVYCARTSARVNAMALWWTAPGDLAGNQDPLDEAQQLAVNAASSRYGAVHIVGEEYTHRTPGKSMIELPDYFRGADNLSSLGEVVYQRPVVEFARLNPGIDVVEPLPPDTNVVVPDSEFAALLAARVAAELSARTDLDVSSRRLALQRLVTVAARNRTALDIVLTRLLLVDPDAATGWLDELAGYVPSFQPPDPTTDPLAYGPA